MQSGPDGATNTDQGLGPTEVSPMNRSSTLSLVAGAVAFGALVYFVPLGLFEPVMRTTNSQLTAWWNLHDVAREVGVDVDQLRSALHDLEDQLDNGAAGDSARVDELAATVRQGKA